MSVIKKLLLCFTVPNSTTQFISSRFNILRPADFKFPLRGKLLLHALRKTLKILLVSAIIRTVNTNTGGKSDYVIIIIIIIIINVLVTIISRCSKKTLGGDNKVSKNEKNRTPDVTPDRGSHLTLQNLAGNS
jgi:hypothetical protein